MFWGLILKANKKYTQTVKKAFHLSTAALDKTQVKGNEDIQVLLNSDDNTFLLCTLDKTRPQHSLDLNFAEGDKICFSIKGEGLVHLTGFLIPDADDDFYSDEEVEEKVPAKKGGQSKLEKLVAAAAAANDDEDDDSDDADDSNFTLEDANPDEDDSDGDEEAEGEEDDDEDDSDDDDEDEDDSDEEEEVQEPVKKKAKQEQPKQNGVANGKDKKAQKEEKPAAGKKSLPGGVQIEELRVGNGKEARPGNKVAVYYEGRLKQNNKVFDSTKQGPPFSFALGKGKVIKGWDVGVAGMKIGGKRRIVCPPSMAYGQKGSPPVIPPNSTLVFDVELKNVH